jgi:hypothetical protein
MVNFRNVFVLFVLSSCTGSRTFKFLSAKRKWQEAFDNRISWSNKSSFKMWIKVYTYVCENILYWEDEAR